MKNIIIREGKIGRRLNAGQLEMDKPGGGVTEWVPLDDVKLNSIFITKSGEYLPEQYGISKATVSVFSTTPFVMGYDPKFPDQRNFYFVHDGYIYEFQIPDNFPDLTVTPFIISGLDPEFKPIEGVPMEIVTVDPIGDLVSVEIPDDLVEIVPDYIEDLTIDDIVDLQPIMIINDPEIDEYVIITPDETIPFPYDVIDPDGNIMDKIDVANMEQPMPIIGIDANGNEVGYDGDSISNLPSKIKITTPIKKLDGYIPGEKIDFTGMIVKAFNNDDSIWVNSNYSDGIIPFNELDIDTDYDEPDSIKIHEKAYIYDWRRAYHDSKYKYIDYYLCKSNKFIITIITYEVENNGSYNYEYKKFEFIRSTYKYIISFPDPVYAVVSYFDEFRKFPFDFRYFNSLDIKNEKEMPLDGNVTIETLIERAIVPKEEDEIIWKLDQLMDAEYEFYRMSRDTKNLYWSHCSERIPSIIDPNIPTYSLWYGEYRFNVSRHEKPNTSTNHWFSPYEFKELNWKSNWNKQFITIREDEYRSIYLKFNTSPEMDTNSDADATQWGNGSPKEDATFIIYSLAENSGNDVAVIYIYWPRPCDNKYLETNFEISFDNYD